MEVCRCPAPEIASMLCAVAIDVIDCQELFALLSTAGAFTAIGCERHAAQLASLRAVAFSDTIAVCSVPHGLLGEQLRPMPGIVPLGTRDCKFRIVPSPLLGAVTVALLAELSADCLKAREPVGAVQGHSTVDAGDHA